MQPEHSHRYRAPAPCTSGNACCPHERSDVADGPPDLDALDDCRERAWLIGGPADGVVLASVVPVALGSATWWGARSRATERVAYPVVLAGAEHAGRGSGGGARPSGTVRRLVGWPTGVAVAIGATGVAGWRCRSSSAALLRT